MRRALVTQNHMAARRRLTPRLALHQHPDPAGELGNLALLPGDNIRQVINRSCQMGNFFFKLLHGDDLEPWTGKTQAFACPEGRHPLGPDANTLKRFAFNLGHELNAKRPQH